MRVIQRLMGVENPLTTLRLYEHTLHFRRGVAEIDTLTEREIHRLRAFGFRVERGAVAKTVQAAKAAKPSESLTPPVEDTERAEIPDPAVDKRVRPARLRGKKEE